MAGYDNVIAVVDIESVDEDDFQKLGDHGVNNLLLFPEVENLRQKLPGYFKSAVLDLSAKSANNFLVEHGAEALAELINQATTTKTSTSSPEKPALNLQPLDRDSFIITFGLRKYQVLGLVKSNRRRIRRH